MSTLFRSFSRPNGVDLYRRQAWERNIPRTHCGFSFSLDAHRDVCKSDDGVCRCDCAMCVRARSVGA